MSKQSGRIAGFDDEPCAATPDERRRQERQVAPIVPESHAGQRLPAAQGLMPSNSCAEALAGWMCDALDEVAGAAVQAHVRGQGADLCERFPVDG